MALYEYDCMPCAERYIGNLKKYKSKKVIRDFIINNKKIDLVKNFEHAHTNTYRLILQKECFGLSTVKPAIKLAIDLQK
jgi:hypothetical protein